MKFSINLDFVYDGRDYLEAIREIKDAGFDNIEICFMQDKKLEDLKRVQQETGVGVELMLSDLLGLTDADRKDEFIALTQAKVEEAKALSCKKIIIASGDFLENVPHEKQLENIETGVRELLPLFEREGMTMLLEPINNRVDHPEAGLWSTEEAYRMVRAIDSENVKLLFDIYHMQVMEGDVTRNMLSHLSMIEHVHCAGSPGRHEPYLGELNYPEILRMLDEAGYEGCVGVEYAPTVSPKEGLKKLRELFADRM